MRSPVPMDSFEPPEVQSVLPRVGVSRDWPAVAARSSRPETRPLPRRKTGNRERRLQGLIDRMMDK